MNVPAQKLQSQNGLVCKSSAWSNHRTTLPQSALRAASSLREGAGNGCGGRFHSTGYSLNRGVTGDFHRPYGTLNVLDFTIHRGTLPQSALSGCQLPQRGSRGWAAPFNRVLANIRGCGRFSSPLRDSEWGSFYCSMWGERFVLQSGGGYGIIWGREKILSNQIKELCKWKF